MSPSASVTMFTPAKREALEETGGVFLVPAESVQRLGQDDIDAAIQGASHQRLEAGAQQRGARHGAVGVLFRDRPSLAFGERAADADLVRDRGVSLIVGGIPRVDGDLHGSLHLWSSPLLLVESARKRVSRCLARQDPDERSQRVRFRIARARRVRRAWCSTIRRLSSPHDTACGSSLR